jgi:hypothetical protein
MATWTKVVTESAADTIAQATSGNAATATALATARNIAFSGGDVTGTGSFDGTANTAINLSIAANSVDDTDTGDVNQNAWSTITVPAGTTSQAADSATDTLAFTAAGGMTITGGADDTIQFSSADTNTNQLTTFTLAATTAGTATTVNHGDTITIAAGAGITTTGTSDGVVTIANTESNTDVDVSVANLKTRLAGGFGSNAVQIGDADDVVTIGNDLVITGDLTVSGDTTTVNTATLTVEDKMIKLADVGSPDADTATGAGIQVERSATEAEWPELRWTKDKGGAAATGAGLTGWSLSNYASTSNTDWAVSVMDFKSNSGAPTGDKAGIGCFSYNYADDDLYIRTA